MCQLWQGKNLSHDRIQHFNNCYLQSCDGCDADGPDNCLKCAEGYSLKNNFCVPDKTASGKEKGLMSTFFNLHWCGRGSNFAQFYFLWDILTFIGRWQHSHNTGTVPRLLLFCFLLTLSQARSLTSTTLVSSRTPAWWWPPASSCTRTGWWPAAWAPWWPPTSPSRSTTSPTTTSGTLSCHGSLISPKKLSFLLN